MLLSLWSNRMDEWDIEALCEGTLKGSASSAGCNERFSLRFWVDVFSLIKRPLSTSSFPLTNRCLPRGSLTKSNATGPVDRSNGRPFIVATGVKRFAFNGIRLERSLFPVSSTANPMKPLPGVHSDTLLVEGVVSGRGNLKSPKPVLS